MVRNTRRSSPGASASATCIPSILRYDTPAEEIAALAPKGIILSGGPSSVYAKDAPLPDKAIFQLGIPMLGICYGLQWLAQFLGGKVEPGPEARIRQRHAEGERQLLRRCLPICRSASRSGIRTGTS